MLQKSVEYAPITHTLKQLDDPQNNSLKVAAAQRKTQRQRHNCLSTGPLVALRDWTDKREIVVALTHDINLCVFFQVVLVKIAAPL